MYVKCIRDTFSCILVFCHFSCIQFVYTISSVHFFQMTMITRLYDITESLNKRIDMHYQLIDSIKKTNTQQQQTIDNHSSSLNQLQKLLPQCQNLEETVIKQQKQIEDYGKAIKALFNLLNKKELITADPESVKFLAHYIEGDFIDPNWVLQALREDDLETVKQFVKNRFDLHKLTCFDIQESKSLETYKYLISIGFPRNDTGSITKAIKEDKTDLLHYLVEELQITLNVNYLYVALSNKKYETAKYFIDKGINPNEQCGGDVNTNLINYFAQKHEFETVQFLYKNGADINNKDTTGVCAFDQLTKEELVELLKQ